MSMTSVYPRSTIRPPRQIRSQGNIAAGNPFTLVLDPDSIIMEDMLVLGVSAAFPTTTPTAFVELQAGRLLSNVKVTVTGSQQGELVNMSGVMLRAVGFAYENRPASIVTLAATSTASIAFEIHYINDEAKQDMLSALNGSANTQIRLEGTTTDLVTTVFTGGAGYVAGSAVYSATVFRRDQPLMAIASSPLRDVTAIARHFQRETPLTATGAQDLFFDLEVGNKTRSIFIGSETGGALADGLVSNVSLQVAGNTLFDVSWDGLRMDGSRDSASSDIAGLGCILFGDDLDGVLDLTNVRQARVKITTTAASTIRCVQDYTQ